ncbi:OsmC family protein [Streptomyces sp. NBC_00103]|uniref:OsmC family protein n=1 Tax=Streptomyces sp. NBC_00103 TaxID=2975653 RepID=UPI002251B2B2|nr:OsmC family protein [Streptomyces sp. NBC_00103]MCX5374204.1 OsmC family protein [Streptomyces sp. NBC_00103]
MAATTTPAGTNTTAAAGKDTGDAEQPLLDAAPDPQPGLREYLEVKRAALLAKREAQRTAPLTEPHRLRARTRAEDRSGVRRIRIRHHQILSDSPADFAGYDLGPASPEIQLGVLSSCLTHIFLIQAADLRIPLDALEVEVQADQDPRAGQPGFERVPIYPHHISYTVHITSPAGKERIRELHETVERKCPIYNLLINPQSITGRVVLTGSPQEI